MTKTMVFEAPPGYQLTPGEEDGSLELLDPEEQAEIRALLIEKRKQSEGARARVVPIPAQADPPGQASG